MRNPRITKKDRSLIKGAIRRAFSRSELYRAVLEENTIQHYDSRNPRCQKWSYCFLCGEVMPRWRLSLDHREPVVPLDKTFDDMTLDELADRMWCSKELLQLLCDTCHSIKSRLENLQRPKRSRK